LVLDKDFLVAPWVEVASLRRWEQDPLLLQNGLTLDLLLQNFLDSLQPHAAAGVRLGYTMSINVYELFSQDSAGEWHFDPARMEFFTTLFRAVDRPVVINLRANHFVGDDARLTGELMAHPSSFALLNDGSPVKVEYYMNPVFAPNFTLDESIPLNRYRFDGFRQAASILSVFDRRNPGIIHAITLAGELHHFLPELANPQAAGQFAGARMTDYSPQSIRDFASWLEARYHDLKQVNDRFGTSFGSWQDVEPPRWDLRTGPAGPRWSHMDSYANGQLPVFGWFSPPLNGSLKVYLDGAPIGEAEYGLSRLDVYDAVPSLAESDVGFRFDLDFRELPPGRHMLHVVLARPNGERLLVGSRRFCIVRQFGEDQPGDPAGTSFKDLDKLPDCVMRDNRFAWLDHPPQDLSLQFNPYAGEWQEFREYQVEALLLRFADIAVEAGVPPEKLYSHQIMPQFEGSWNRVAFAVPAKPADGSPFSPGINLYGGSAVYRGMAQYLQGTRYGVPELHPRMGKTISRDVFLKTLEYHRDLGASFVCPYFMGLREPQGRQYMSDPANLAEALLIHPLNIAVGSLYFYSALMKFLNE
jgi:hypothetical protein